MRTLLLERALLIARCWRYPLAVAAPAIGKRYYYGEQDLLWVEDFFDCSLFGRGWSWRLGVLTHSYTGRTAAQLADDCDPIEEGQQQSGHLGFFGTGGVGHTVAAVSPAVQTDDFYPLRSYTVGANSGGASTFGTDPNACVKFEGPSYWSDGFITYGQIKEEFGPTEADLQAVAWMDVNRLNLFPASSQDHPDVLEVVEWGRQLLSLGISDEAKAILAKHYGELA